MSATALYAELDRLAPQIPDVHRIVNTSENDGGLALRPSGESWLAAVDAASAEGRFRGPSGRVVHITREGRVVAQAVAITLIEQRRTADYDPGLNALRKKTAVIAGAPVALATVWRWVEHFGAAGLLNIERRGLDRTVAITGSRGGLLHYNYAHRLRLLTPSWWPLSPVQQLMARAFAAARAAGLAGRYAAYLVRGGLGTLADLVTRLSEAQTRKGIRRMATAPSGTLAQIVRGRRIRRAGPFTAPQTRKHENPERVNLVTGRTVGEGVPGGDIVDNPSHKPARGGPEETVGAVIVRVALRQPPHGNKAQPNAPTPAADGVEWRRPDGATRTIRHLFADEPSL